MTATMDRATFERHLARRYGIHLGNPTNCAKPTRVGTGQRAAYGLTELRRVVIRRILTDDRSITPTQRRILEVAADHDTGWVLASEGQAWWQADPPSDGAFLAGTGRGLFAIDLATIR